MHETAGVCERSWALSSTSMTCMTAQKPAFSLAFCFDVSFFSFLSLIASGMHICLCFSVFFSLALSVLCPAHLSRHRANEPSCVWTSANHLSELTRALQEEVCSAIIQIIQTISQNHSALFPTFHHIPHPLDHFILLSLAVDHSVFLSSSLMELLLSVVLISKSHLRYLKLLVDSENPIYENFKPSWPD